MKRDGWCMITIQFIAMCTQQADTQGIVTMEVPVSVQCLLSLQLVHSRPARRIWTSPTCHVSASIIRTSKNDPCRYYNPLQACGLCLSLERSAGRETQTEAGVQLSGCVASTTKGKLHGGLQVANQVAHYSTSLFTQQTSIIHDQERSRTTVRTQSKAFEPCRVI